MLLMLLREPLVVIYNIEIGRPVFDRIELNPIP